MNRQKFVTDVEVYTEVNQSNVDSNCIDILFYNSTAGTIFINGFPVGSGSTLSIDGNVGEINVTSYKIAFNGNAGSVYVQRRKYA
jgi:hypothetical protein